MLRLHTFGGCFLVRDGERLDALSGQRKALALLAVLAAAGERGVSRETMLAYLWPESDESRARSSLKQLVYSMRQQWQVPEMFMATTELRLSPAFFQSDVADFRDAERRGAHAAVVDLHVGPFLDGFNLRAADGFERWAASERASTARAFARSLTALAERASARGERREAVELWRRLANAEPLSTRAAAGLIRALDAVGERAAALRHAEVYEILVREEVGGAVDPSIAELVASLRRLGPVATVAASNVVVGSVRGEEPHREPAAATSPTRRTSVAVLPFVNTSGDPNDEPFSDGLTDELIGLCGRTAGLTVTGRTSAFAFKGSGLAVRDIAERLGVATVLEGSVRRTGDRLKVTVQLVRASDDQVLWAEMYRADLADVFVVQEEIARSIVAALRVELGTAELPDNSGTDDTRRARLAERPSVSAEAYELYLRGRYLWNSKSGGDGLRQALRYFERAAALEPSYAPAHAGISDVHALLAVFGHGRALEEFAAAKAAALRALALDEMLAEAHVALAHVQFLYDYAWAAAERSFRRATTLDSSNTAAHFLLAVCLQDQGRFEEAFAEAHAARALDPLSPHVGNLLGRVYVNARRPDDAIRHLRDTLELSPDSDLAYQQLGHAYLQKGMHAEALAALHQAAALSGPRDAAHLAYAYAVTGDAAAARRIVQDLVDAAGNPNVAPFHIAMAYVGLGETDMAFAWLERGYDERAAFMDGVKITPAFEPLHADPRWAALLRRMGLTP